MKNWSGQRGTLYIDLSKFMIQKEGREGLLKEGNEWMSARLLNLKTLQSML
jgi:hypothetical protein